MTPIVSINNIFSINSSSSTSKVKNTSNLSFATRLQLQALGIDETNVTSEAQAQMLIENAQSVNNTNSAQSENENNSSESTILSQAKSLASQLGVNVSDDDSIDDIINNLNEKVSDMLANANNDPSQIRYIQYFQDQIDSLSSSYQSLQANSLSQAMSSLMANK